MTGRPRRVGWFDAVPLRYAVAVNSVSSIMLNKLDILSGHRRRSGCASPTRSTAGGSRRWPSSGAALARATPIYEEFPGWAEPIHDVRSLADLPENARRYVSAIEEHAGVPIVLVSVGPERTQTIERAWRPMRHRPGPAGMSLVMPTRILIVGGGGREHALAWKLAAEPGVNEVIVAPGSARSPTSRGSAACRRRPARRPARSSAVARRDGGRARRRRAGGAAGGRRGRRAQRGRDRRSSGRPRRPPGSRSSKAFCHEVAAAAGVPMARAVVAFRDADAARGVRDGTRGGRAAASSSRPTAWRPARA